MRLSVAARNPRRARSVGELIRNGSEILRREARQTLSAASKTVHDEAERVMNEQKGGAAQQLSRAGNTLRRTAHALHAINVIAPASYAESAAEKLAGAAQYIEGANLDELTEDASALVKRHPAATMGGLFIAGLLAARFLKATQQQTAERAESDQQNGSPQRVAVRRRKKRSA